MIPQFPLLPSLTLTESSQPPDAVEGDIDFSAMFAEAMQQEVEPAVDPGLPPDAMLPVILPAPPLLTVQVPSTDEATFGVNLQTAPEVALRSSMPDGTGGDEPEPSGQSLNRDPAISGPVSTPDSGFPPSTDPTAQPAASLPIGSDQTGLAMQTQESPPPAGEAPPKTEPKVISAPPDAPLLTTTPNNRPSVEMPPVFNTSGPERRIVAQPKLPEAQAMVRVATQTEIATPLTEILLREAFQTQDDADSPVGTSIDETPIDPLPLNGVFSTPDDPKTLRPIPHDMAAATHAPIKAAHSLIAPESVAPMVAAHARSIDAEPLEIVLNPQELGHLRFEIRQSGEQVSVLLTAERPETLDLMRRHADQLVTELRQSGFSDASLSFGQWAQGGDTPPQPIPVDDQTENPQQISLFKPAPNWSGRSDLGGSGLNLRL